MRTHEQYGSLLLRPRQNRVREVFQRSRSRLLLVTEHEDVHVASVPVAEALGSVVRLEEVASFALRRVGESARRK